MKILKTIIVLAILSLFTISCSNDDNESETIPVKPAYLLTKSTNNLGYSTYTYDANNKLTVVETINPGFSNYKTTFFYNSNGKIEEMLEVATGLFSSSSTKVVYIYDGQNRLIEKKYLLNSYDKPQQFDYERSTFFEYNGNSVIHKIVYKGKTFATDRSVFDFDSNGNILKCTSYNQIDANNPNGLIYSYQVYTYDDKLYMETSFPAEYKFPYYTKNNIVKSVETNSSNPSKTENVVYEYNSDGYPTKKTSGQYVYTYEYKKL